MTRHPGDCLGPEVAALTAELVKAEAEVERLGTQLSDAVVAEMERVDAATGRVLALAASWESTADDLARQIAVAAADPLIGPGESAAMVTAEATCRRHARQLRKAVAR